MLPRVRLMVAPGVLAPVNAMFALNTYLNVQELSSPKVVILPLRLKAVAVVAAIPKGLVLSKAINVGPTHCVKSLENTGGEA